MERREFEPAHGEALRSRVRVVFDAAFARRWVVSNSKAAKRFCPESPFPPFRVGTRIDTCRHVVPIDGKPESHNDRTRDFGALFLPAIQWRFRPDAPRGRADARAPRLPRRHPPLARRGRAPVDIRRLARRERPELAGRPDPISGGGRGIWFDSVARATRRTGAELGPRFRPAPSFRPGLRRVGERPDAGRPGGTSTGWPSPRRSRKSC